MDLFLVGWFMDFLCLMLVNTINNNEALKISSNKWRARGKLLWYVVNQVVRNIHSILNSLIMVCIPKTIFTSKNSIFLKNRNLPICLWPRRVVNFVRTGSTSATLTWGFWLHMQLVTRWTFKQYSYCLFVFLLVGKGKS